MTTEPTNKGGRPPVGPVVNVRLPADLLAHLDREASAAGETRAQTIRRLLTKGLRGNRRQADGHMEQ